MRSRQIYGPIGARYNDQDKMWRWPNGARLRFAYLEFKRRGALTGPSVELPVTRRGRTVCGVSHVWHAPRACHGHPHERARHARVAPLVRGVILGLGIDVLGPGRIVLEGRDRSNAVAETAGARRSEERRVGKGWR